LLIKFVLTQTERYEIIPTFHTHTHTHTHTARGLVYYSLSF
jgi:hypothetical protein